MVTAERNASSTARCQDHLPTESALLGTALLIGGSMLVSVIKTRHLPREQGAAEAMHGWVPGSPAAAAAQPSAAGPPDGRQGDGETS